MSDFDLNSYIFKRYSTDELVIVDTVFQLEFLL